MLPRSGVVVSLAGMALIVFRARDTSPQLTER
jgi:hypothetical protein